MTIYTVIPRPVQELANAMQYRSAVDQATKCDCSLLRNGGSVEVFRGEQAVQKRAGFEDVYMREFCPIR